jgi:signal transduction histidine kinase
MHVRELRPGLALAEGQIRFEIDAAGETHVVEPRCSFVLERRGGRWLIAHFHFSMANAMQGEGDSLMDALENRNRQLEAEAARRAAELERALADLRATQGRLVQQEKLAGLGRLTAGVAHEIKNPLNFVNNFAALSVELSDELHGVLGPAADGEVAELLGALRQNAEKIREHGERADAIVRAMMQHARGDADPTRRVGVNALVEEHVQLALGARRNGAPGVEVVREFDPAAGEVEAAPQELGRVMVNLVQNALDAVAERAALHAVGDGRYAPRVSVRTERAGVLVRIVVADNGVGLPAGSEGLLFEPFYTTKPTGRGNVGLGLSLSRDVVVAHGGEIGAAPADGGGAVFTVTLPAL